MRWSTFWGLAAAMLCVHAVTVHFRDTGYGGPHHDEVIALLASNALERDYGLIKSNNSSPINVVVSASQWQEWTSFQQPVPFSEIAEDVLENDKHPPLSFWLLNRWIGVFGKGGYREAVWLSWLQVVFAALLLGLAIYRQTGVLETVLLAAAIFLFGNSAIFTASWVRQYALLGCCYSALILLAAEYGNSSCCNSRRTAIGVLISLVSLVGMMTQYTFLTMSFPVHCAILWTAGRRYGWAGFIAQSSCYLCAGVVFLLVLPGAVRHALTVSKGLERTHHWSQAFAGLPEMLIPLPGAIPVFIRSLLGLVLLILLILTAGWLIRSGARSADQGKSAAVPAWGVFGAGLLQVILVGFGYFPAWGTGPNHTIAFWLLTTFCCSLVIAKFPTSARRVICFGSLIILVSMQVLFIWHSHRLLPRLNTLYPSRLNPDLVMLDNLARGYVLQVTDVLSPDQQVFVSDDVSQMLYAPESNSFQRILYLPMEDSVASKKQSVIAAASRAGWTSRELPVVHPGTYEAILLERPTAD